MVAVLVSPGDAAVPRGGAIEVHATLRGFGAEGAELLLRADTANDWIRIPMLRDSATASFTARLFDLTRATEYYVEVEAVRSRAYHLTISDLPAVQRLSLELRFPAYTGLPPEKIESGGDVAALIGTTVTVHAAVTKPVQGGAIRLDGGATSPLAPEAGGLVGRFRITRDGFYRVDLVAADGTPVPGAVQYVIEALEDHPPTVAITEPGRDTKVTSTDEVTLGVRASDDFGVGPLELLYAVNGGAERRVALTDSAARGGAREVRAAHTLFLEELGLKPGDLVGYHATAKDGAGHTASSDIYFLEIRPFGRDYKQAESGGGGGGGGADNPDGLSARQREIVAGTFNWLRDSARTAEKNRRENLTTLAISEGRLKEDVNGLVRRLEERQVLSSDSAFLQVHAELGAAGREMQAAEEQLGRGNPGEGLPSEQRALQHLQRAEAAYRQVEVQMGGQQGGGGGGGSASKPEDLADLFELETDKLRNQYESVQQGQAQTAQRELDETAERLKQLAARLQQENERAQRAADALRNRLGQESSAGGGGGGSAQRELARQAEEEARRLERLAREQRSPELADAARRMQESADAMRRAATGSSNAAGQASAALDKLRGASRDLENARAARMSQGVRDLEHRAGELAERQKEIAQGVGELPQASGADRADRLKRLDEKKDALAAEVDRLGADAERLAKEAQRDQPGAAAKLGQAAETIQETRIRDKVVYSKSVMRGGSAEYAKSFEGQITSNFGDVTDRLKAAAGALTESSEARRDRALEKARELVRGLESLKERTGRPDDRGPGSQPGGQQGGQQGSQPGGRSSDRSGNPSNSGNGGTANGSPGGRPGNGDPRQLAREFGMRRQGAEDLRRDVARQGVDLAELDRAIADLRRLESGRPFGDPQGVERLQAAIIEGLKTWEFKLWRTLGQAGDGRPAQGAAAQVPPEYRALVEEYYRSLAKPKPPR